MKKYKRMATSTSSTSNDNNDAVLSKRRKVLSTDDYSSSSELENNNSNNNTMLSPENCGRKLAGEYSWPENCMESRWCSNDSSDVVKEKLRLVDLESNGSETENSAHISSKFSVEMNHCSPTSSLSEDSEETSSPAVTHRRGKIPAEKIPSQAEIEEFFVIAEERERKRFAESYNFDIVRDEPLEGRFEWVLLKP